MKLVDKDALVAEIESLKSAAETMLTGKTDLSYWKAQKCLCERFLSFINTLEVKEVDLNEEIKGYFKGFGKFPSVGIDDCIDIAKYFFELGLKTNQENNVIGILERVVKIDAGGYPYIDCDIEFYDYDKDIPLAKEGDKVKVVVVKGK